VGFKLGRLGDKDFVFNMNELQKEIFLYIAEGTYLFATIKEKNLDR